MTFIPARNAITNITQANPAVVTTQNNHNFITGDAIRMHVPKNYGMAELNQLILLVTVLSNTTFSLQYSQVPPAVDVDSRNFTTFTIPSNPGKTAEVLSVGSGPSPKIKSLAPINNICDTHLEDATFNNSTSPIPF